MFRNKEKFVFKKTKCLFLSILVFVVVLALFFSRDGVQRGKAAGFTVTNTNDSGAGSLRQAIIDANNSPGQDVINFNIPGAGPHIIQPTSVLPTISDDSGTTIDGYTQTGASVNVEGTGGLNAALKIIIDGSFLPEEGDIFKISGDYTVIKGLNLANGPTSGGCDIRIDYARHVKIQGNYLGTDIEGMSDPSDPSASKGVCFYGSSSNDNDCYGSVIGTDGDGVDDAAERNLISGYRFAVGIWNAEHITVAGNLIGTDAIGSGAIDNFYGLFLVNASDIDANNIIGTNGDDISDDIERNVISGNNQGICMGGITSNNGTIIAGNYIGVNAEGTGVLGNIQLGIYIGGASYVRVGTDGNGTADLAERNVIVGNGKGIWIAGASYNIADYNTIAGNYIGVLPDGITPAGNTFAGVLFGTYTENNVVGSLTENAAEKNIIANNEQNGIASRYANSLRNTFRYNSVYNNGALGITLSQPNSPLINDAGDTDSGSNGWLNYPVIEFANLNEPVLSVGGTLDIDTEPELAVVEVYASDEDSSGYGEGRVYLGKITPNVDGTWSSDLPLFLIPRKITATTTDKDGNTSEFSENFPVDVQSLEDYNVWGFAWSEYLGWISHNHLDTGSTVDYGVNIGDEWVDGTLLFSGYAWSDHYGWIDYAPEGPYPNSGVPDHSVRWDPCTGEVSGWAKVLNLGDSGWISLSSPGGVSYGVNISMETGAFEGYSWGDEVGWIHYNPNLGGVMTFPERLIPPLEAPLLIKPFTTAPGSDIWFDYPEFRDIPLLPSFSWTPFDQQNCVGSQESYTIQVSTDPDFSGGFFYSRTVVSDTSAHVMDSSLNWNTWYYWRVKVKDEKERESPWATVGKNGEENKFKTPLHAAPDADFFTQPVLEDLNAKEEIYFFDASISYGGASIVEWRWDFGDGTIVSGTDPEEHQNPAHVYHEEGVYTVSLKVTDSDGYWDTKIVATIPVKLPLPEFQKVIP